MVCRLEEVCFMLSSTLHAQGKCFMGLPSSLGLLIGVPSVILLLIKGAKAILTSILLSLVPCTMSCACLYVSMLMRVCGTMLACIFTAKRRINTSMQGVVEVVAGAVHLCSRCPSRLVWCQPGAAAAAVVAERVCQTRRLPAATQAQTSSRCLTQKSMKGCL